MPKKHQIILPSFTKSNKEKLTFFPITLKLEKHNVDLLKSHGYKVTEGVKETFYKLLPPSIFRPFLLHAFMFLQDVFKGKLVNSDRYPYLLLFLKNVYKVQLTEEQEKIYTEYYSKSNVALSLNGKQSVVGNDVDSLSKEIPIKEDEISTDDQIKIPKKVILLSSNTVGIGKTTTSNKIVEQLANSKKVAFAGFIREQLTLIFQLSGINPKYLQDPLYSKYKNQPTTLNSEYSPVVIRDLLCDYSDLIQKHFGENYWAICMTDYIADSDYDYIIIDDLRRPIELDFLKQAIGEENILTVYLTKADKGVAKLSQTSSNYEGQLDSSKFDIQFEFNSDWSNTNELIDIIKSKIN